MLLPNEGVEFLLKHQSTIINIFHFEFNEQNHFISLSDDGEIIEWIFNPETLKAIEIIKFHLKRPSDDLLSQKKHTIKKLKKGEYYKITKIIQFDNYIVLGYSDGVILVYEISKKQKKNINININEKSELKNKNENKEEEQNDEENQNEEKNKNVEENKKENKNDEDNQNEESEEKESNSISESDKIKSESNINLNDTEEDKETKNEKENNNEENINDKVINLDYYNFYRLYYVLLGHLQEILSLCYIPQLKMLISSSDDHTVKMFDFETGHLKYFFKLDFIINRILFQNISKNKNDSKIVLTLLSNDPVKVLINLSNNPITFNNFFFKHNDIIQLEKINDKFYGLNSKNVILLDKNLELEGTFISLNNALFQYFNKFNNDYLIVDNENCIRLVEFILKKKEKENEGKDNKKNNEKNKKNVKNDENQENEEKTFENIIITDCKFKVGEDTINGFYFFDKYIFIYCQDGKLYLVNYNKIKENYERMQMTFEDAASLQMMASLVYDKKPKKKVKGKKGKDKKK